MKKPSDYELKRWLCENTIVGIKLYYYQTGTETSDTDWELETINSEKKRFKSRLVKKFVDVDIDWIRVLRVKAQIVDEMRKWDKFAEKEKEDLAEYERLKDKFSKKD